MPMPVVRVFSLNAAALFLGVLVLGVATAQTPAPASVVEPATSAEPAPRLIKGNDQVIAPPRAAPALAGPRVNLKFENTPLADVVHVVLRDLVQLDYVIHPPVGGTITLSTREAVSTDQALYLLEAALQANGLALVRDVRGIFHVGKPDTLRTVVPGVRLAGGTEPLPPGTGSVVIPLRFIGAGEMATILRATASPEAILRVDTVRNLLVMAGGRSQVEGWLELVNTFDVDLLKGMSVGVFPLRHASARDIELAFRIISAGSGGAGAAAGSGAAESRTASPTSGSTANASGAAASGTASPGSTASTLAVANAAASFPLHGALRVLPIDRLNSVLVVTPRAAYLEQARDWIAKLDQPGLAGGEPQLFVYPVQNGNAAHLASVLGGLFGQGNTQPQDNGVAPGLRTASQSTGGSMGNAGSLARTGGGSPALDPNAGNRAGASAAPVSTVSLPSGLRVMADPLNNAVLVYGTRAEYDKIEATLRRLDVPPTQVMIEASIVEVTLTDELQYGLQWLFNDRRGSNLGTGILSTVNGGALGGPLAGFSYTLRNSTGQVQAVLNALAEKSLLRVISSPSLMVLDNHTASISVGNQQPVRTTETITDGGNRSTSIQYKDTGVSLSVTPSVNAGNMVTLQLLQSVTDVGNIDTATGQRSFLQRQLGSKVAVRSGETLVLGGLIQDNSSNGNSGVPVLKDVPVVGALFGARNRNTNRTELVVVITPRVVRSDDDARGVSQELRERLQSLQAVIPPVELVAPTSPANPDASKGVNP